MNPCADRIRAPLRRGVRPRRGRVGRHHRVRRDPNSVLDVVRYLHDDPAEQYDYLVDVTAVEYRDIELPIEVVWHLRSLPHRRFLRLKAELAKGAPLRVPSVWPVYHGADWLERECYDMFGIGFEGHPDLRRILMWEQYAGGFSAAEGLSAPRPVLALRAVAAGAGGEPGGALLHGRAEYRRRVRGPAARHAAAAGARASGRGSSGWPRSAPSKWRSAPPGSTRRAGPSACRWWWTRTGTCHHARGAAGARARARGRAHAHQHRAAAPGDARRAAPGAGARRRDGGALHSRTSATCTAASRRSASTASTTRSFPGPIARTISTRRATTSPSR